jgi:hypothetical protein
MVTAKSDWLTSRRGDPYEGVYSSMNGARTSSARTVFGPHGADNALTTAHGGQTEKGPVMTRLTSKIAIAVVLAFTAVAATGCATTATAPANTAA